MSLRKNTITDTIARIKKWKNIVKVCAALSVVKIKLVT